ncbi:uncharacterized protein [Oscarella lobularis]|uniref:uncharacterized protein n=1 Tax=Oscarella lobularis TaxID=121494 RepID=UPI003313F782
MFLSRHCNCTRLDVTCYACGGGRSTTPFILVGSAGAGKSAVIARSAVTTLGNAKESGRHTTGENVTSDLEKLVQETNRALADPDAAPSIQYSTSTLSISALVERSRRSVDDQSEGYHRSLASRSNSPKQVFCASGPLNLSARRAIITETFARYNKRLDDSQMRLLLSKDGSANPLWRGTSEASRGLSTKFASWPTIFSAHLFVVCCSKYYLDSKKKKTAVISSELLVLLGDEGDILPPSRFNPGGTPKRKSTVSRVSTSPLVKVRECSAIDPSSFSFRAIANASVPSSSMDTSVVVPPHCATFFSIWEALDDVLMSLHLGMCRSAVGGLNRLSQ